MQPYKVWVFSDLIEKNKRVFKVPVYQRNYDWTNIQCEKLYQDIMKASARDHKHFTGTIVYIVGLNGSSLNEVLIIDGQQRITTMYILLKALLDASIGKSARIEQEIKEVMFNRNCEEEYKLKLKPVKSDNEQLVLLIKDRLEEMDRNSNIYKNYILFKGMIEQTLAQDEGLELGDILNGIKKLEMVEIVLDKSQGDEPQKIFESINSTGLELSLADLIRNYLLMDDEKQDDLYENYWCDIEKNVGYKDLGDFVINFLNSRISKSVNGKNAYRLFKSHCDENNISHKDVLVDLKRTSKYYGEFIGNNDFYSKEISKRLRAFKTINQTTILPLIFRIFDDFEDKKISEETLCKVLDYLLVYLVRIITCEINKNLNKFFKSVYERVYDGNYENYYERLVSFLNNLKTNDRMPNDKEFADALIYKPLYKKHVCKFMLAVIENSTKEQLDVSNLTIEHILPQKENAAVWKAEVGEDYNHVYEVYLHTLGNLTITGHNSELGTKKFAEKKKIIQENSKANILNKDVLAADKWNEQSIIKRAQHLAEILQKEFQYVDVDGSIVLDKDDVFTIDTDLDFSNSKPAGFTFMGEYNKASNWIDLLTKFLNLLYDLDTQLMVELAKKNYSIPNASSVYLTNDKRILRTPKEIGKCGIFYEANLSSNSILSFIKALLVKARLDADDFNFTLSKMPFSTYDENTWAAKYIAVAKLFYNLLDDLVKKDKIDEEEIEKLKNKAYTKFLFQASDYPAIANHRDDNKGNSQSIRYRKDALRFKETEIFVSTQFFESDRQAIIDWYKGH